MNVDELFSFAQTEDGCVLVRYLKKDDPTITEIEIPSEYHGFPVERLHGCFEGAKFIKRVVIPPSVRFVDRVTFRECTALESVEIPEGVEVIGDFAFWNTNLKSVTLPESVKSFGYMAFACCHDLENVVFNSFFKSDDREAIFGRQAFVDCFKLPADITLMGLVNSCDISKPFDNFAYLDAFGKKLVIHGESGNEYTKYTRPDVFELAVKNDCFRSVDVFVMLKFLIEKGHTERLIFVAEHGLLETRELVDKCIECSAREGLTELTAYLLNLKNRKFGFNGGNKFEL